MATGVSIELDAHEVVELARAIRRASRASLRPLMQDIADEGEYRTRARIREGGPGPDGTPWPERHPSNPNPHPLLNLGGGLYDSIESDSAEDAAIWGSSLVYARIHQLGGTIRPSRAQLLHFEIGGEHVFAREVTIPARPYLGYGDAEREGVVDLVEAWLVEAWLEEALTGGGR